MKRRKVTVAVLSVVLAAAALTGCGSAQQTNGPKKTRVVLNEVAHSIFYAPMYVAIEEGYFEDAGIDLELVTGFGADKTMTAVLTGEADIGFMGSESTIYTYAGGTEDYVVNFAQLTQRAGNFLVAREPIDDFSWDMLKGTTVLGGRAGGMPEMVFEYILEKNNMDPTTDLSIDQSIDFGSTAAAFSGGQGDFTIEFEPHATLLEQKGDGYVVASLGEESGYVPYTSFSAKKNYLEKNPETIQAFTDALQKGMDYSFSLEGQFSSTLFIASFIIGYANPRRASAATTRSFRPAASLPRYRPSTRAAAASSSGSPPASSEA